MLFSTEDVLPPGQIFACYMASMALGSTGYSLLLQYRHTPDLAPSLLLAHA